MSQTELQIENLITGGSWAEGAASPERRMSFLDRRLAAVAISDTDFTDEELALLAA